MSDYVVRPKRRRNGTFKAVDPCLGYYIPLATGTQPAPQDPDIVDSVQETPRRRIEAQAKEEVLHDMATNGSDLGPDVDSFSCAGEYERLQRHEGDALDSDTDLPAAAATASHRYRVTRKRILSPPSTSSSLACADADWAIVVPGPAASTREAVRSRHVTPPRSQKAADAETLTVEAFLKRSSEKKYTSNQKRGRQKKKLRTKNMAQSLSSGELKNQDGCEDDVDMTTVRLRSRKVARVIAASASSSSESEAKVETSSISFEASSPAPDSKMHTKSKNATKKSRRSLKQRIYEAAISTHGDPDPYFARPAVAADSSTRMPMRFVPGGPAVPAAAINLRPLKQKKKRTLVDPRKSAAIRTASFSSRIRPPHLAFNNFDRELAADGKAVSNNNQGKWKWDARLGAPSIGILGPQHSQNAKVQGKNERARTQDASLTESGVKPLVFVSMHEAEDRCSSLFLGRGVQTAKKAKPEAKSALQLGPVQDHVSPRRGTKTQQSEQLQDAIVEERLRPKEVATEALHTTTKLNLHQVALSEVSSAQAITPRPRSSNSALEILSPSASPPADEVANVVLSSRRNSVPRSLESGVMVDGKQLQPLASFTDKIMATILTVNRAESSKIVPGPTTTFRNNKRVGSSRRASFLTT